jgi:hypothetical protein
MDVVHAVRSIVGKNVARRRAASRMTIAALAAESGCSPRTIHGVVRGAVGIGVRKLDGIARPLGCTVTALFDEKDDLQVIPEPTSESVDVVRVLGRNLATMCRARGFENLEALAVAAELGKTTLYEIVNAKCDTSIDRVGQLGVTLRVEPGWLLCNHVQDFPGSCTRADRRRVMLPRARDR